MAKIPRPGPSLSQDERDWRIHRIGNSFGRFLDKTILLMKLLYVQAYSLIYLHPTVRSVGDAPLGVHVNRCGSRGKNVHTFGSLISPWYPLRLGGDSRLVIR